MSSMYRLARCSENRFGYFSKTFIACHSLAVENGSTVRVCKLRVKLVSRNANKSCESLHIQLLSHHSCWTYRPVFNEDSKAHIFGS